MTDWMAKPALLRFKCGVSIVQLERIWDLCKQRLSNRYRLARTAAAAGPLPFAALLLTLYRLRCYPTFDAALLEFGYSKHATLLAYTRGLDALQQTLAPAFLDPVRLRSIVLVGRLQYACMVVDSTTIALPRQSTNARFRFWYYYKSPTRQGVKLQIVSTLKGRIVMRPVAAEGSRHDVRLARNSGLLRLLSRTRRAIGDAAYIGLSQYCYVSKRRRRGHITAVQRLNRRLFNRILNGRRSVIERVNHRVKLWAILNGIYRSPTSNVRFLVRFQQVADIICSIYNMQFDDGSRV